MAAPVGVVSSDLMDDAASGTPLSKFGRGGRRDRHQAVGALDHAVPGRHGAAGEALDAEQIEADGGARDVGDAVEGADFVEVDLLQRHAMHRRLRLGQPAEDAQGQVALPVGQPAAAEDLFHVRQNGDGRVLPVLRREPP